jgi:D-glycerate 3-kinase
LTSHLAQHLSSKPHNLKLATLSLDDIYPPHSGLQEIKERHPNNRLLEGRGSPGTHDLELGVILEGLQKINGGQSREVVRPIFDKSLHSGEGDRMDPSPSANPENFVSGPLDVVIEGWCIGFSSISSSEMRQRWDGMSDDIQRWCKMHHVQRVNEMLEAYEALWAFIDVLVQVPADSHPPSSLPRISLCLVS